MSKSLYWTPPPKELKKRYLGALKWVIADRYGDPDNEGQIFEKEIGSEAIPFLDGIIASGNKDHADDAQQLRKAIEKYGSVIISLH